MIMYLHATPGTPVSLGGILSILLTGTATTGNTLTATLPLWDGATSFTYQWMRDDVAISGATSKTYTIVEADEGTDATCVVTTGGVSVTSKKRAISGVVTTIPLTFNNSSIAFNNAAINWNTATS